MSKMAYTDICEYIPPTWCKHFENCPTHRVRLAILPTPIHSWKIPGLPDDIKLSIKRDDLTGSTLSGNKVRKLEFVLADAIQKGCASVITSGDLQSNHCRATTIAATQLGLKAHLILRTEKDLQEIKSNGNLFLSQLCNANIFIVPKDAKYDTELKPLQKELAKKILATTGKPAYSFCGGLADLVGLYGYLDAWEELMHQGVQNDYDDIVLTFGSGCTVTGLAIGNYLTGSKVKIHGIAVSADAEYYYDRINNVLKIIGLEGICSKDILDIVGSYEDAVCGVSTRIDREYCHKLATTTGIICDPVYSGKGARGLVNELQNNRHRFKGDRILFVHTGGIFGLYDRNMLDVVENDSPALHGWKDIIKRS